MIQSLEDIEKLKTMIKKQMYLALWAIATFFALLGLIFIDADIGNHTIIYILSFFLIILGFYNRSLTNRVKELPTSNDNYEKIKHELIRIWKRKLLPKFEDISA